MKYIIKSLVLFTFIPVMFIVAIENEYLQWADKYI